MLGFRGPFPRLNHDLCLHAQLTGVPEPAVGFRRHGQACSIPHIPEAGIRVELGQHHSWLRPHGASKDNLHRIRAELTESNEIGLAIGRTITAFTPNVPNKVKKSLVLIHLEHNPINFRHIWNSGN